MVDAAACEQRARFCHRHRPDRRGALGPERGQAARHVVSNRHAGVLLYQDQRSRAPGSSHSSGWRPEPSRKRHHPSPPMLLATSYMFWHDGAGEDAHRSVYMTVSHDDGFVWEFARTVNAESEGACNCCNLRALTDRRRDTLPVVSRCKGQRPPRPATVDLARQGSIVL